ncbi:MAG: formylglycine-generating enzyme family protein [Bradymonadia bacterium]
MSTRADWMSDWGEDDFGTFACFEVDGVVQRLRWIEPGTFLMGSPKNEEGRYTWEGPQHQVTLTHGFWLGDTPVTQALWVAVMGDNPSRSADDLSQPVECVSWHDAQRCLKALEARLSGVGALLPTEAQWEYACRAGTSTRYWSGDDEQDLYRVGWYGENSGGHIHPVAQKPASPWGLYDMHGNVFEWCADAFSDYTDTPTVNPGTCVGEGDDRVIRGGAWGYFARTARAAVRDGDPPDCAYDYLGFRIVLSASR